MNIGDTLVSFWPPKFNKKGDALYPSIAKPEEGRPGSILQHKPISWVINFMKTSDTKIQKRKNGMMFFFCDSTDEYLGIDNMEQRGIKSVGLMGLDIDNIECLNLPYNLAERFLEHFDEYVKYMPQIYLLYVSSSGHGAHVVVKTDNLTKSEYAEECVRQLGMFCKVVEKVEGVNIMSLVKKKTDEEGNAVYDSIPDPSCTSMAQRQFTNPSPTLKVNDNPVIYKWSDQLYDRKTCLKFYNINEKLAKRWKFTKYEVADEIQYGEDSVTDEEKVTKRLKLKGWTNSKWVFDGFSPVVSKPKYEHLDRMHIYSSVSYLAEPDSELFDTIHDYACKNMYEYGIGTERRDYKFFKDKEPKKHGGQFKPYCGFFPEMMTSLGIRFHQKVKEESFDEENIHNEIVEREINLWKAPTVDDVYEVKTYLSNEYKDFIIENIKLHDSLTIKGNTGIGKTVAITELCKEYDGIIAVPFIAVRNNYEDEGVPVVDTRMGYTGKACCMTYDRLASLQDYQLIGKTIFIDECHVLNVDVTYRNRLVLMMRKLQDLKGQIKVVYVSATPLLGLFETDKVLTFWKKRPYVHVYPYQTESMYTTFSKVLKDQTYKSHYNRILIFSNTYTRMIKDNNMFMNSDELSIIHSQYEWTGDTQRICQHQLLDSQITAATSMAFNGLNFNNENEKILIVSEVDSSSMAWEIIQQVGRIRKSVCDVVLVMNSEGEKTENEERKYYKEKKMKSEIFKKLNTETSTVTQYDQFDLIEKFYRKKDSNDKESILRQMEECATGDRLDKASNLFKYDRRLLNEDTYAALERLDKYKMANCGYPNIREALLGEGYFIIEDFLFETDKEDSTNKMKKRADTLIRKAIKEDKLYMPNEGDGEENLKAYYKTNLYKVVQMLEAGVNLKTIKDLFLKNKRESVIGMIDNLLTIFSLKRYDEKKWQQVNDMVDGVIATANAAGNYILARDVAKQRDEHNELYNEYKEYDSYIDITKHYIELYAKAEEDANAERVKKNGGKLYDVTDTSTGKQWKMVSKHKILELIGCDWKTVSNIIDGKSKKYNFLTITESI